MPGRRGGRRPGAGRPRGRTTAEHGRREQFTAEQALLITLRLVGGVPSLEGPRAMSVVRRAAAAAETDGFRVVEVGVHAGRVALLVRAAGARELTRGMTGLKVRLARRMNRLLRRCGSLFAERYRAQILRSSAALRAARREVRRGAAPARLEVRRARRGSRAPDSAGEERRASRVVASTG